MEPYRHHHLLFPKRLWRVQDPARGLQEQQWLKPPLYDPEHQALHAAVSIIPVPGWDMSSFILERFQAVPGDYLKSVDNLLLSIENTRHNRQFDAIERALGQLMIQAIDSQRPFILGGLVYEDYHERAG